MVLPTNPAAANVAQTPAREAVYFQAGKGNILSHFAGLATPDNAGKAAAAASNKQQQQQQHDDDTANSVQLRQRRGATDHAYSLPLHNGQPTMASSTTSTATVLAPSPVDNNNDDNQFLSGANVIAAFDDDHEMDDAKSAKPSREASLSLWKLERQQEQDGARKRSSGNGSGNGLPRSGRSKSINANNAPLSSTSRGSTMVMLAPEEKNDKHDHNNNNSSSNSNSNQSDSMFSLHISPPRHQGPPSRRSTMEGDARSSTTEKRQRLHGSSGSSRSRRSLNDTVSDPAYSSDSYSLQACIEFLSRDLEEEERAANSQSDKQRAFLYKKRYMDAYGFAVSLSKRVYALQNMQSRSSNGSSNNGSELGGSNTDEKKLESLCRQVDELSKELQERDSLIASLHSEQKESAQALDDLKMSQSSLQTSEPGLHAETTLAFIAELEDKVTILERENAAAVDQVGRLSAQMSDMQEQHDAAQAERVLLQNSMRQTEEQLDSVHTQWLQEKADWEGVMDTTKSTLTNECDKLRRENTQLKEAAEQGGDNEKELRTKLDAAQRTALESKQFIHQLEEKLRHAQAQIAGFGEKESRLVALQDELEHSKKEVEVVTGESNHLRRELTQAQHQLETNEVATLERVKQHETQIYQAESVRRILHNKVMELKGNIRVFCRVRPVLRHEVEANANEEIFHFPDYSGERRQIELLAGPRSHVGYGQGDRRESIKKYPFDFDLVFNGACSQEHVFMEVSALIQSALDGYDVCIFAYGQTGSGKTYTMQGTTDYDGTGPSAHMGIVGRAIGHIFGTVESLRSSGWEFTVSLELIEIYNETLRDLLAPPGSLDKVVFRQDADGKPVVTNQCFHVIENEQAAWTHLQTAMGRRATKTTNMNDRSSRSHCVISFRLNGVNSLTEERRVSVVHLVDLAGSERLSKSGSGNDKDLLKETQHINKSLSSLGNVICALAKRSSHVPFRDSKLTHFLSPSLGGESKTLMICNLSPLRQHREETLNSLRFAKTVNSCEIAFPSFGSRS